MTTQLKSQTTQHEILDKLETYVGGYNYELILQLNKIKNPILFTPKTPSEINYLGYMYSNGYGVEKDYNKAVEYYTISHNSGNIIASHNLGFMYLNGYGVEKDYNKAIEYYTIAHNSDNIIATCDLGMMYLNGYGVEKDYNKAIEYYTIAHNSGNIIATCGLGMTYLNGYRVEKDYNKAVEYYTIAHNSGNIIASHNLGMMYYKGYGVENDYNKAVEYFTIAHNSGNIISTYNLGMIYYKGAEKDYNKAVEYFIIVHNSGDTDTDSDNILIDMYKKKQGNINYEFIYKIKPDIIPNSEDYYLVLDLIRLNTVDKKILDHIPREIIFEYLNSKLEEVSSIKNLGLDNAITSIIMGYNY